MRMDIFARHWLVASVFALFVGAEVSAQQYAPQQQGTTPQQAAPLQQLAQVAQPQQPIVPQPPEGFQLNQLQQAELDQVLDAWQQASAKISTFDCPFQRWEYNLAFGPKNQDIPLHKNQGTLGYQKPDKGSFQITEVNTFREQPVPAGQQPPAQQQGNWVKDPNAIGDHWVCDGTSVYQYRQDLKQVVEYPIPPQFQGQAIVDGPLPFLFGADAKKLQSRYWLRVDHPQDQDPNHIWLVAKPKYREQAADFTEITVILDRQQRLLPRYMRVFMPNGNHDVYIFDIDKADVNGLFNRVKATIFSRPSIPKGWKHVVENMPMQQAAQPAAPPR
jgi:TIGR03009 family protein